MHTCARANLLGMAFQQPDSLFLRCLLMVDYSLISCLKAPSNLSRLCEVCSLDVLDIRMSIMSAPVQVLFFARGLLSHLGVMTNGQGNGLLREHVGPGCGANHLKRAIWEGQGNLNP